MIKKIKPYVHNLINENKLTFNFIDVGARNGTLLLKDLAPYVDAYGFEPNPAEYDKLVNNKTDALLLAGIKSPNYKSLKYYQIALSNFDGKTDFYVTQGPSASGLLEPSLDKLNEIKYKERAFKKSFGEDIFKNYKKIEVETNTLDNFSSNNGIKDIDFLKIDVEGSEYEVLEGAKNILKNVGVIRVETCFIPFRKDQKLFSHVDILLRESGFDLFNYEIVQEQIGYKEKNGPIKYIPNRYIDPYGQPLSCDAIYINRKLKDIKHIIAQAIILLEYNLIDEALFVLKNNAKIDDSKIVNFLKGFKYNGNGIYEKLETIGYKSVDNILRTVGKIYNVFKK